MVKIALIGIVAALLAIQFRFIKSEYGVYISITGCLLIFALGVNKLETIISVMNKIQSYISINHAYLGILLKIIGITYVAEFSSDLCKDMGHAALAGQIELVGKLTILTISMPILLALLETINKFLSA